MDNYKMCDNEWINYSQPIYRSDLCFGGRPHCIRWEQGGTAVGMIERCVICGQVTADIVENNGLYEREPR